MKHVDEIQEVLQSKDTRKASVLVGARGIGDDALRALCDLLIERGSAREIYEGARRTPSEKRDVARFQKALLAAPGNIEHLVAFAYEIPGADLAAIGSVVAKSESWGRIGDLLDLHDLPSATADELRVARSALLSARTQDAVSCKDAHLARSLACEPGVDVAALQRVVLDHGDAEDLFLFAVSMVPGSGGDVVLLEDAFLRCEPYDERFALYFATTVSGADTNKFGRAAAERGSASHLTKFLEHVTGLSEETRTGLQQARDRFTREATHERPAQSSSLGL